MKNLQQFIIEKILINKNSKYEEQILSLSDIICGIIDCKSKMLKNTLDEIIEKYDIIDITCYVNNIDNKSCIKEYQEYVVCDENRFKKIETTIKTLSAKTIYYEKDSSNRFKFGITFLGKVHNCVYLQYVIPNSKGKITTLFNFILK